MIRHWVRAGLGRRQCAVIGIAAAGALASAWPHAAVSAPQSFNTALPVAQGEFIVREQFVLEQSGDDPSGAGRDRTAWALVSALGYGVTADLAIFAVAPYVDKRLDLTVGGERRGRGARGLGDLFLFARYTVFKKDWPGRTIRVAPFAGVEMPTGASRRRDAFGLLPASVQPGSGSWDPFGGVVVTYQTLDFQVDAQIGYKINTKANGFRFGDVARFDASLQYRLWPRNLEGGVPGFLYGVLELNLSHRQKNRVDGARDSNSGGTTLFLSPGLQYVTRRWIIEAGVQLPTVQNLNGTALRNEYILRAGFRLNF